MKLCIPVALPQGLDSLVEPDLPSAEHLLFFDTESRLYEEVSLSEQEAGAGAGFLLHAVLCGSINRATLRTLIGQGVAVYGTAAATVAQAIAQYENGELTAATLDAGGCAGHQHGHGGGCCSGAQAPAEGGASGHHCHGGGGCGGHGKDAGHRHEHGAGGCCGGHAATPGAAPEKARGDVLRIAVCSQNRKTVTEHAGKCRKFWIYEVQHGQVIGKDLLELPIEQSFHASPAGQTHPLDAVDILISAGIGAGLQQRLLHRGTDSIVTTEETPDQAVAAFLASLSTRSHPASALV